MAESCKIETGAGLIFDALAGGAAHASLVLPGIGHFVADQAPDRLNELLLAHLAKHPE